MVIITRSKTDSDTKHDELVYDSNIEEYDSDDEIIVTTESEEEEEAEVENEEASQKPETKKLQIDLSNLLSSAILSKRKKKKKKEEENDENEEEEYEEEDSDELYEDDFRLPSIIRDNKKLTKRANRMISKIKSNAPNLKKILYSKLRYKDQMELFELFYVYRYSEPNSEERILLKNQIKEKMLHCQNTYRQYQKYGSIIDKLEKGMDKNNELFQMKERILNMQCDDETRMYLYRKYIKLEDSEHKDEEYIKNKLVLQEAFQLPFEKIFDIDIQNKSQVLKKVQEVFDDELYGMKNVKEQILLLINNKLHHPNMKGCCIGLIGPPGVGKTTIANCIAKIFQLPFEQIPLGGLSHGESMKGHDSTYIGSRPGQIATAMMKINYKNGILFFDEFDKINENNQIVNTMLHITDFQQNHQFRDNYFGELNIDLSSIWFICSMNEKPTNQALADRIFYIEVDGYSMKEKKEILTKYIIPKTLKSLKMNAEDVHISDDNLMHLLRKATSDDEKGVRSLNKAMHNILSKLLFLVQNQQEVHVSFMIPDSYFPLQFPVKLDEKIIDVLLKDFMKKNPLERHLLNLYV